MSEEARLAERDRLKRLFKGILVVAAVLVGSHIFWNYMTGGGFVRLYEVPTTSMKPTLNVGDLLVVFKVGDFKAVKEGDVIVFRKPGGGSYIVHRVYEVFYTPEGKVLRTKGDNNPYPDPWLVEEKHYVGRVVLVVPKAGPVYSAILQPPIRYLIIAVLSIAIIVLWMKD